MSGNLHFVSDLALILISAGIITLLFKWLKQPLVLGYIVAGFLVGPNFKLFPTVIEINTVNEWSEIGIIFLLFTLGLEFSFRKLLRIGRTASITAGTEILSMLCIGFLTGCLLNFGIMESFFLGGMLSMSSTTIILKSFDELNLRKQKFTGIVFGTLIVEDLVAVLLLVLLSTAAVSHQLSGGEMIIKLFKLLFFLVLWVVIGIFVLPSFFRWARKIMNDETLLVISIGLCFGMVMLATYSGFSFALGAFVMGSILAETIESERIMKLMKPIKELFGAIFFVSVGMMVDPIILVEHWSLVLILTLTVLIGRTFFPTLGVLISGQPLKTAIKAGWSFGQIGEFAFIIATLGIACGVLRDFVYPVIVSVSVLTTFTTPYFMRLAEPFYNWLEPHIPERIGAFLEKYASGSNTVNHNSDWNMILRFYSKRILVYTVVLTAIMLAARRFFIPFVQERLEHLNPLLVALITSSITILIMAPFLRGLMVNKRSTNDVFVRLWSDSNFNRGGLVALVLLRVFIAVFFVSFILYLSFQIAYGVLIFFALAIVLFILFSRSSFLRYARFEKKFIANLNQKEELERKNAPLYTDIHSKLSNRDIQLQTVKVSPDSLFIGEKLQNTPFRKEFGVIIVKIERGHRNIYLPTKDDVIYPYDELVVLGTDSQISRFSQVMEKEILQDTPDNSKYKMELNSFSIEENSPLVGKTIQNSGVRYNNCLIVGVERGQESEMNPSTNFVLQAHDLVWIVGEKEKIKQIINE